MRWKSTQNAHIRFYCDDEIPWNRNFRWLWSLCHVHFVVYFHFKTLYFNLRINMYKTERNGTLDAKQVEKILHSTRLNWVPCTINVTFSIRNDAAISLCVKYAFEYLIIFEYVALELSFKGFILASSERTTWYTRSHQFNTDGCRMITITSLKQLIIS